MCDVDHWMEKAFELANEALEVGEVPIGCVFVYDNKIIASGRNTVNETRTAIDHAEMNCVNEALSWCKENGLDWKNVLPKTEVVVTVEPCIMCASALIHLNIPHVTFGCDNLRFGGCGSVVDTGLVMGNKFKITRGLQTQRAITLLKKFYEGTNPNAPLEKAIKKEERKKRKLSLKEGHGRQGGGRNPAVRDAIEDEVLNRVDNNPSTSTRRVAGQLGVSHSSVWRVWHRFGLHPYHKQKVQTLNPNDYPHRVNYCQWYLQKCQEDPDFPSLVLHSDEAMFSEEGILNTRNNIFWAAENPHATYEHGRQNKFRVNVWAGILGNYIIGPYLLPDRLNGQNYLVFLREVLPELLRNENIPDDVIENMWLQHDGAPAHYARAVRDYLNVTFPLRWIGRGGPVPWPARSPDLTPLDFFSGGV